MKLTEAEWLVMNALWDKYPATAREVAGRLPAEVNWAYTTIKTMLTRLIEKRVVTERKRGNTSVYEPRLSRRKAQIRAVRSLADVAFDGAFGPLMHFLLEEEKLTSRQRKELVNVLAKNRKTKGERK